MKGTPLQTFWCSLLLTASMACAGEASTVDGDPESDMPSETGLLRLWSPDPRLASAGGTAGRRIEAVAGLVVEEAEGGDYAKVIEWGPAGTIGDDVIEVPPELADHVPDVLIHEFMHEFGMVHPEGIACPLRDGTFPVGRGAAKITAGQLQQLCSAAPCSWQRPE